MVDSTPQFAEMQCLFKQLGLVCWQIQPGFIL